MRVPTRDIMINDSGSLRLWAQFPMDLGAKEVWLCLWLTVKRYEYTQKCLSVVGVDMTCVSRDHTCQKTEAASVATYQRRGSLQLWQFLVVLLNDPVNCSFIAWTGRGLEFKLIEPEEVGRLLNIQEKYGIWLPLMIPVSSLFQRY